jgi:Holliday junction DNA helicase RuvB
MSDTFNIRDEAENGQEKDLDRVLRPKTFDDFTGQRQVLENLEIFVKAAKLRSESLDHVLLHGPPGLGKTTLGHIISNEMGVSIKTTSGPVLDKPADLAGLLTNLETNDILFIDEIQDYCIDLVIDTGPNARSVQIKLNPFTLIGATTRSGLLTAPLRARFGINARLSYYDARTLTDIVQRSAEILNMEILEDAAYEVARRSRGTPRIANALLRRVRDFAQIKGDGKCDLEITQFALNALNVDTLGLDEMDHKILYTIIDKFNGGPVGLNTVATAVGEDSGTIEEVYEPYLIQEGFIMRTPRGRQVTETAYRHLGKLKGGRAGELF